MCRYHVALRAKKCPKCDAMMSPKFRRCLFCGYKDDSPGMIWRVTARPSRIASANQLDDAGNRISRPATAYAMRAPSPSSQPSPG